MEISDIITEFGAFYQKGGQNITRIYSMLRANTVTETLFTPVVTDDTLYYIAQQVQKRVLQPFQKAFTPIDGAEFSPKGIQMYKMKVDDIQYPDELEATWLGFLAGNGLDRTTWPFVRYYVENVLIPQLKEDEEMNEIFWGVRDEPTPGTAGAASTSMNGINKIIIDGQSGGSIVPVQTGTVPTDIDDLVDYVEEFADGINKKYWRTAMPLAMSEENARLYARGYDKKYGKNTNNEGKNDTAVSKTNLTVIGLPSMIGSDGMWATPKANAIKLLKRTENINNIKIEGVDRSVKLYTDYSTGIGFGIDAAVFTNDQFEEAGS